MLASLVDSHNNILVPGFYGGVRPNMLTAALARLEASHEFSLDGYKAHVRHLFERCFERAALGAAWEHAKRGWLRAPVPNHLLLACP